MNKEPQEQTKDFRVNYKLYKVESGVFIQQLNARYQNASEQYPDSQHKVFGTSTWSDGTKYVGEWLNGKISGQGRMDWPDGSYYIGEWKDNIKHGPGILVNTDGRIIEGTWVQDNLHGTSKVTSPDGRVENVVWRSGVIDMEDKIDNLPVDDNQWLNVSLVAASAVFGISGLAFKEYRNGLFSASLLFYGVQLIESFTSQTWSYICNVTTPQETTSVLKQMISSPPIVSVKIQNYHYEDVEIESKKTNEDSEYKEKKKNLQKKREAIDEKIEELKEKYFTAKERELLLAEKATILQEETLLIKE